MVLKYVQEKGRDSSTKEVQLSKALSNAKLVQEKGKFDSVKMPNLKSKLLSLVLDTSPHLNEIVMICGLQVVDKSTPVSSFLAN